MVALALPLLALLLDARAIPPLAEAAPRVERSWSEVALERMRAPRVDCAAVEESLGRVAGLGRTEGAVTVLLEARRSTEPCVLGAGERARAALGLDRAELLSLLLRPASLASPEAGSQVVLGLGEAPVASVMSAADPGVGAAWAARRTFDPSPVDPACGLEIASQRVEEFAAGPARLVAELRNVTGTVLVAHRTVLSVKRRGTAAWRVAETDDSGGPMDSRVEWDASLGEWSFPRARPADSASFRPGTERTEVPSPPGFEVAPQGTFEVSVPLPGWRRSQGAAAVAVRLERCDTVAARPAMAFTVSK